MNFPKIAEQTIEKLGGKSNITTLAHCATRLRLTLADESKVDKEAIENIEGVKGQFSTSGQYQIIFGSGTVNKVHAEMQKQMGIGDMSTSEVAAAGAANQPLLQRLVKGLADIFVPIIPAIVAGGLLMGIHSMLTSIGFFWEGESVATKYPEFADLIDFINTIANAPFVFLPVLLGFSATRKFGGNPFLGAALGMLLVHPALADGWNYAKTLMEGNIKYWNVLGFEIEKVGYQGTVIPTIVSAWVLATLEKGFRKFVPSYLDNLVTPMMSLFIAGVLAFTVIGPFGREAGSAISAGLTWLYDSLGFIGGAIFGTFYAPIVITGMHQTFIAVETQLLAEVANTGGTFIFPIAAMSNIAQGAACLGVAFAMKDAKVRGLAVPSGISALLGITEPAMFGVNLRYRQAFIAAMIGSGLASAFIAFFNVKAIALGAAGFLGVPSIKPDSLAMYSVGMAISFIVAFSISAVWVKKAQAKK
ncbi:sucrose-specific PTS transporter subunit IIBC [Actinobacillus equuli subsp. equuli]|uniref:protein-N(pi)-phosphohistidine--sucrose phosphotransferase n=1 Tax=Actinobacillus equuli subsp. equuli TaxID=202947 RepID=A0A9X4G1X6_ACTEU|nr:sucrose-specific PTS transporter subunit IIBC [Actinobacillus equuli]MDE8034359.1 sucrose-specific PTS transporter subunit IIBC [Actinobacillus equuli subsp. equuli]MDG4949127.1 sucrose-specific PTS transporter subunit IIBC [Actinobacillus equuli subsp. haemolyticus]MDG4952847.1 sucrose-specific PTS transporter subunit IIBC [Actinobacillus equuli subsp. equuli]WGE50067.1 sucrose-specific PTS transporter subunit IIBC [Actinobacillus equuli subsp. haemolyticus]WGE52173.1 sucrose-specific PTS 